MIESRYLIFAFKITSGGNIKRRNKGKRGEEEFESLTGAKLAKNTRDQSARRAIENCHQPLPHSVIIIISHTPDTKEKLQNFDGINNWASTQSQYIFCFLIHVATRRRRIDHQMELLCLVWLIHLHNNCLSTLFVASA